MKSLKYFLLLISISSISFAQEMSVKSFEKLERDMTGRTSNVKDINGDLCALLKVVTTEKGFEFGGCNIEKTEQKTSEIWVFVSPGVRFITIRHEKFGLIRNYKFPETISPGNVYQMTLLTKDKITPIDSTHISNIIDSKMENMMQLLDERLPNKNTTIETTPTIKTEEPVIKKSKTKEKKKIDNSPLYRPTGSYLNFTMNGFAGNNHYDWLFTFYISYKYQITSGFALGLGTGITPSYDRPTYRVTEWVKENENGSYVENGSWSDWDNDGTMLFPIYAEIDLRTPRYKWNLFLNFKVGVEVGEDISIPSDGYYSEPYYNYGWDDKGDYYRDYSKIEYSLFFANITTGVSYKNINLGLGTFINDGYVWFSFSLSYNLSLKKASAAIKKALF